MPRWTSSEAILRFSLRSSVPSAKELLSCKLQTLTELLGGSVRFHGDYPAWTYARESALRDRCVAVYEAQYGAKPQIVAIHAGLECGILSGKIDGLDCISFGPNLLHVHTPNERADIASVARVWEYLKAILAYKAVITLSVTACAVPAPPNRREPFLYAARHC